MEDEVFLGEKNGVFCDKVGIELFMEEKFGLGMLLQEFGDDIIGFFFFQQICCFFRREEEEVISFFFFLIYLLFIQEGYCKYYKFFFF